MQPELVQYSLSISSILPLCPSPSCSASLASPGLLSEGVVVYLRDRERGTLGGEEVRVST